MQTSQVEKRIGYKYIQASRPGDHRATCGQVCMQINEYVVLFCRFTLLNIQFMLKLGKTRLEFICVLNIY